MGLVMLIVGFIVLWALIADAERKKRIRQYTDFHPTPVLNKGRKSSAGFADKKALRPLLKRVGVRIGHWENRVLRYSGPGHILICAAARKGKGISILIPLLLDPFVNIRGKTGSRLIIDPKAENYHVTARNARKFSDVVVLDPMGIAKPIKGVKRVGLNVVVGLDPRSNTYGSDVSGISEGIVVPGTDGENGRHFNETGRQGLGTTIRIVRQFYPADKQNLVEVRKVIAGDFYGFCRKYAHCGDEVIENGCSRWAAPRAEESRELESVRSTMLTQTEFIEQEGIREFLKGPPPPWADMKRKAITAYCTMSLSQLATESGGKLFRLALATGLATFMKEGERGGGLHVQIVCDEFFSACAGAPLRAWQTALSNAAGASQCQLVTVIQDLGQIESLYPHNGWRTFLANSAVQIYFGCQGDKESSERIAQISGQQEMVARQRSVNGSFEHTGVTWGESIAPHWEPVIQPWEVRNMTNSEALVVCEGVGAVIKIQRKPYFETREFRGRYDDNPLYHGRRRFWR